ncbi:MAG TPA: class I SAM-dependent methyltransferase [Acidobacteriaceae bacterium]|nr:class I SAM-dependent methyltransferase [Acidobacteriaceae bacterium]
MKLEALTRKAKKALINSRYLLGSRIRVCRCCERLSFIASFSEGEEVKICVRCGANLRYEMLATYLRAAGLDWGKIAVLELDHRSPLRPLLSKAKTYYRSFYSESVPPGSIGPDGGRCEDITKLTFPAESLDVILSSDVLEHVPDVHAAFRESHRVLRPGGFHLFTVPPRTVTRKRAEIIEGKIHHLMEPDYHSDPLDPQGILAFWDYGPDAGQIFKESGLDIAVVAGPIGKDQRIIWKATKRFQ